MIKIFNFDFLAGSHLTNVIKCFDDLIKTGHFILNGWIFDDYLIDRLSFCCDL